MNVAPPALLTIGYEGKTLDAYVAQLTSAEVSVLCDVRHNPLSRKRGFSKKALAAACNTVGIRYEHLAQLGIPTAERRDIKTPRDRELLFQRYSRITLRREKAALETIRRWILEEGERVALTCFEANPCDCHRNCVARVLTAEGIPPALDL